MQIVDKDPSVTEHVMKLGSKVLTFQQTKTKGLAVELARD